MTESVLPDMRRHRAAASFGCDPDALADGLLRFTGQPGLNSDPARAALTTALDLVAEEPQLPDWIELARIWVWHGRLRPRSDVEALAPPARSVHRSLCRYAEKLDGETLRSAVLGIVPREWVLEAVADAVEAHGGEPDAAASAELAVDRGARQESLRAAAELELVALIDDPPSAWGTAGYAALRAALVWRLTYLSAVLAEVAGTPQAPPLSWQEAGPGRWRAVETLPGATAPLTATVKEESGAAVRSLLLPLSVSGSSSWNVGETPPHGATHTYGCGGASGVGFAKWHADHAVQQLRCTPGGARRDGRLLIPVRPSAPVPVWHVSLGDVLNGVVGWWGDELLKDSPSSGRSWVSLPHVLPDGTAASAAAGLLQYLEAPRPTAAEPANRAAVDSAAFTGFLATHAVSLTAAARAYLAGLADSGPGQDSAAHRHAAAMRAVLALLLAADQATAVATEIGPPPVDGGYRALLDPHRLVDHVQQHTHAEEEPPAGLDPLQLAAVRAELGAALASTSLLHMRRALTQRNSGNGDLESAVREIVRERNTFLDPEEPVEVGPDDPRLPSPALGFAVSFATTASDLVSDSGFTHSTRDAGPVYVQLWVPPSWGHDIAAAGFAVLARHPVLHLLRSDDQGRPDVVRVLRLDAHYQRSDDDRPGVWQLDADCPLVNVDWRSGHPRLYIPEPAGGY
ncbi:hypothetical protein OG413_43645 [Streptomyces sp. NBC_01433]|uniref:hypothetical protein n=1 Tax=Streptomyces sp. NBC_01433 TaxID=2903864 RepID=UPI00224C890C|nr:hypothetical protein [Streptomyces sp. NBC_01433]MCX4682079.1 hypothetical protein [Streptomyces sp. NBC_01433]